MCFTACLTDWHACHAWKPCAYGYFDKGNNASWKMSSWWSEIIWHVCHRIYFASSVVSTWVLYLQICQFVYPLLLESSCLLFWCFSSICCMGRTAKKVVWSGSSKSQFISVHLWISVSYRQKLMFAAANCIVLLSKAYKFVPWEYTYGLCITANFI